MKKILFTLLSIFLLGAMGMSAETVTLDLSKQGYANAENVTAIPVSGNLAGFTFGQGEGSSHPKYYNSGTAVRMYTNNTLTVSAKSGYTITSIKFTTGKKASNLTVDSGTVTQGKNASWAGEAASVFFTAADQFHIVKADITLQAGGVTPPPVSKVATPEVTPASGTYFRGQEVTMTCATPGAKISYIINLGGGVVTKRDYTAPFELTQDCSLAVTAEKEGMTPSETVNVSYTVKIPTKYGFKKNITSYKRYILVANYNEVAKSLPSNKDYGYLYSDKNDPENGYISLNDNTWAFQITTDGNGVGQIADSENRFYYMTEQYNSFQANPTGQIPVDADLRWKYEPQADGTVKITHIATGKWIQFNDEKHSFGAFNTEIGTLPKLYEEDATADTPIIEPVVLSPAGGIVDQGTLVTITSVTPGVTIKYAIKLAAGGGGTPKVYEGPISIDEDCRVSAYAEKTGMEKSPTVFVDYKVKAANPLKATFNFANPETLTPSVDRNNIVSNTGYSVTEPFTNNGIKLEFTDGTTETRFWNSADPHLRVYQEATFTISCIEKEISIDKITITGNKNTDHTNLTPNIGTYTTDTWVMEWDPNLPDVAKHAFTVTFTKKGKTAEITSIDVLKKVATGVEDSEIKIATVFGTEGGVEISGVEGYVVVYNVYGQQVANEYVNGNATIETPAGVMIVKAGETVTKVLVK